MESRPINVYSASGIGDCIWPLMKILPNTNRQVNLYTWKRSNVSSPFLYGIKGINKIEQFTEKTIQQFIQKCDRLYKNSYVTSLTKEKLNVTNDLYLFSNNFLESGKRIEQYLPKLGISFDIPWKQSDEEKQQADIASDKNTIVIYTSSVANNDIKNKDLFGDWNAVNWITLFDELFKEFSNCKFVWIGSSHDISMKEKLQSKYRNMQLEFFIDKPAEFIIPLLKNCKCFISYQSGMSVISVIEKVPTIMFYFNSLDKLRYSWCPLDSINDKKLYNPILFKNLNSGIEPVLDWINLQ